MQPNLSPIRIARNMYRAALASTVADILPRLMERITAAIAEQGAKGDMYTVLYTKDDFTLEHKPSGLEALLGECITSALLNEECVPSGITVIFSSTFTPKTFTITVRGSVALCTTNEKGTPNGVDMVKEVKTLVESRKRKREEDAVLVPEEPAAKQARTDDDK